MRYVVLTTDVAPTYAVWAPIAARLWVKHGYRVLLFVEDSERWAEPFVRVILNALHGFVEHIVAIPRVGAFSVANTMRCARLIGASVDLNDDAFVLTADVDMMPLQRDFFQRDETFVVLRALSNIWTRSDGVLADQEHLRAFIDLSNFVPGGLRFPMCYCGATVRIWRELFPEIVVDDATGSLARIVGDCPDSPDFDELLVSHRFLTSARARGRARIVAPGVWAKGELALVDPVTAPLLSSCANMPRAMLRFNDFWAPCDSSTPPPPEAIDYIPLRFYPGHRPFGAFDVVSAYFPEEHDWMMRYRETLQGVLT